ncbi:MAG: prephenate dehydrogenase/arogenate dehydrogenase family protein [Desulfocapsa sp.]|uniref:Prephenate dehydrogenase n=1 Tax=Desulfotalea psychrophila TaxID=84980 RepID=A0ABS3AS39_9BACT|nr:prephenate dehydrogenase/arogenate dehydrogenase family protein [Desulfocapsa sp.]MBN4046042.1 prephenate dehydrogenase/arogenate dehydrogenase family protein [bacterium AH-315-P11]MBN4067934.1 prephenate dehydrogenase/arogenate dehydrogenase family protein [Desulfotalea psychrophila]
MISIATLGPQGSDGYRAALQYSQDAKLSLYNRIPDVINAFLQEDVDIAFVPIYNTREGEIKEYFHLQELLVNGYWVDNLVLPIHLSFGCLKQSAPPVPPEKIIGRSSVFKQCDDYLNEHYPNATLMSVPDIGAAMDDIKENSRYEYAIVDSEELLLEHGFEIRDREIAEHNRTRFAILGGNLNSATGYDASAVITRPLKDRVGMLVDILGEFTKRGINILDLRSENDIKSQKLQIYLEIEGHIGNKLLQEALKSIETDVIQEENSLRLLGSFPRVDMRVKKIRSFGFIGTGDMSTWFAERLENEGYTTLLTGRSTHIGPEEMIAQVDVVIICVPISVTVDTINQYGPLLKDGQAMILLAGESEQTLKAATEATSNGVELMLVHNLWGPQAQSMKDKNASVVRTPRSGSFCSEFEAFLYKHGADISHDSPTKHDLLMGVGQKLPTTISTALAMTLKQHSIACADIGTHSTLTSLYGILAMARIHNQNPRTYAEIMSTGGDGRKIVRSFAENLLQIVSMAEEQNISGLCELIENSKSHLSPEFLAEHMKRSRAVDSILTKSGN